jgi:hypothetical protein
VIDYLASLQKLNFLQFCADNVFWPEVPLIAQHKLCQQNGIKTYKEAKKMKAKKGHEERYLLELKSGQEVCFSVINCSLADISLLPDF